MPPTRNMIALVHAMDFALCSLLFSLPINEIRAHCLIEEAERERGAWEGKERRRRGRRRRRRRRRRGSRRRRRRRRKKEKEKGEKEKEKKKKKKGKQQQGGPAPSLLETISGEFALVISGHSLVSGTHQPLIGGLASTVSSTQERSKHDLQSTSD